MKSTDQFKRPSGEIGMFLHKGGIWLPETNALSSDALILDMKEMHNLIVNNASILMAERMAPGSAVNSDSGDFIASGLQFLAVGQGPTDPATNKPTWDLQNPPAPELTNSVLLGEITRKQFTSWTFLDVNGNAQTTASNVLQLVTTFLENEAVGPLVEMGIFGGDATATINSGTMFNYKTFPVNFQAA